MKKIANILANSNKNKYDIVFNVVKEFDEIDKDIPTLIIGLENAKKYISDFNILTKKYGNVWWTFTKTERRCEYEDDIVEFYNYAILNQLDKIKYIYIDLIKFGYNKIKKIVNFFGDDSKKYVFITKNSNFMFIYSEKYKTVFGLSLELCEYIGINKRKIYKLLKNQEYVNNTDIFSNDIKKIVGNRIHYLPILYTYFKK